MQNERSETHIYSSNDKWIVLEKLQKLYEEWLKMRLDESIYEALLSSIRSIGDFAREMENREHIGETYIKFLFSVVRNREDIPPGLVVQCLRVIGNCCIDHAENRKRVVDLSGEDVFLEFLNHKDSDVSTVSLTSLLNLCMDSDLVTERLEKKDALSKILKFSNPNTNFDILARIIGWLMSRETKKYDTDCFMHFLSIIQFHSDNVVDIFSIILMFLPQNDIQLELVQSGKIYELLNYFYRVVPFQEHFNSENKSIISVLINLFGEIAANYDYVDLILNNKPIMDMLLGHLNVDSFGTLIVCSCVMLGNLARTDKICIYFVHELNLHEKLINIINSLDNPKVIYSSAGFLKNLSITKNNKFKIGEAGAIDLCMKLFSHDLKSIQYLAVSIFRQLIIDEEKNASFSVNSGVFEQLLELRKKTDDNFIIMEASRALSSMIRTINKFKLFDIEKKIASYTGFEDIFKDMITQTKYPIIRTDAIFALVLIARSSEEELRKNAINLIQDENILNTLVELGRTGAKDIRDNIQILLFSVNQELENESIKSALLSLKQDIN
ncbi:uncharacterized protein T551_02724 [Pneumocystis jirovecii RU7]|uniref:UNC-45/Cro1/She4 central domain-containing protein n=2 Tax=Pneumocystis jirovecii TaxID=42068 RepID=A0A0W4ZIW0_PNEJ7|nr:uncharacterized protein T551_02724 [Pneumocystis jirovecii RU7]KTW28305.1 hypothetical protein T551_02724 [Pneumocystis jirovecii RU7]